MVSEHYSGRLFKVWKLSFGAVAVCKSEHPSVAAHSYAALIGFFGVQKPHFISSFEKKWLENMESRRENFE